MNNDEWARKIFSETEMEELSVTSEKIVHDSEHGIVINIGLSNDMCVDLVEAWFYAQQDSLKAQMHMLVFMEGFIDYLKDYLRSEEIPFDDYE
jgi:hypothetical protein